MEADRDVDLGTSHSVPGVATCIAPTLSRESLIVMSAQIETQLGPSVEVALGGNSSAARSLVDPVADVLGEGSRTDNRWLVDLCVLPDVVAGSITSD